MAMTPEVRFFFYPNSGVIFLFVSLICVYGCVNEHLRHGGQCRGEAFFKKVYRGT